MLNGSHQNLPPSANNGPASSTTTPIVGHSSTMSAAGNASSSTNASRFDTLEQTLEMFVENSRHLCVIVSDFPGNGNSGMTSSASAPNFGAASSTSGHGGGGASSTASSQAVLNQKIQTLVSGLQELDAVKHHFQDVKIPFELFDQFVDAGRNPQSYTKECMERTLNKNKQVNGKIELYKKFRANLLKELSEEFPKEAMQYRAIRESASSTSSSSTGASAANDANAFDR